MVQNYTPVMWDDKAFAFVPYEAFSGLPHYPKEKCEQICKELNSLISNYITITNAIFCFVFNKN